MRSFRIGRLFGIPIELDLTFLLILPLFAYLIGTTLGEYASLINDVLAPTNLVEVSALTGDSTVALVVGLLAAVGLFVGVIIHELGHSLVAMRYGFPISSIKLWLFGGVAQLSEMPEDWKQEFSIAVAGPIVSLGLGVVAYLGFLLLPTALDPIKFVVGYLALTNVVLAAFNMLPGFPMDGGRVLRALLARTRPHAQATKIAAEVGKVFAFLLGIFGLFTNLFLIALAFFIYIGASSEAQQTVMKAAFEGVTVTDVMTRREDLHTVDTDTSVAELLDRMFVDRHTGYPVLRDGRLVGVVTLDDARSVKEVERDAYRVEDVMSADLRTVSPDADAMAALQQMQENKVGRLPVVDDTGEIVGLISRSDLVTAFNVIQSRGTVPSLSISDSTDLPNPR